MVCFDRITIRLFFVIKINFPETLLLKTPKSNPISVWLDFSQVRFGLSGCAGSMAGNCL